MVGPITALFILHPAVSAAVGVGGQGNGKVFTGKENPVRIHQGKRPKRLASNRIQLMQLTGTGLAARHHGNPTFVVPVGIEGIALIVTAQLEVVADLALGVGAALLPSNRKPEIPDEKA